MNLKKNISSLKLPHYKATAGMESVRVAPPKEVLLPMNMHSGQAAEPVVASRPADRARGGAELRSRARYSFWHRQGNRAV